MCVAASTGDKCEIEASEDDVALSEWHRGGATSAANTATEDESSVLSSLRLPPLDAKCTSYLHACRLLQAHRDRWGASFLDQTASNFDLNAATLRNLFFLWRLSRPQRRAIRSNNGIMHNYLRILHSSKHALDGRRGACRSSKAELNMAREALLAASQGVLRRRRMVELLLTGANKQYGGGDGSGAQTGVEEGYESDVSLSSSSSSCSAEAITSTTSPLCIATPHIPELEWTSAIRALAPCTALSRDKTRCIARSVRAFGGILSKTAPSQRLHSAMPGMTLGVKHGRVVCRMAAFRTYAMRWMCGQRARGDFMTARSKEREEEGMKEVRRVLGDVYGGEDEVQKWGWEVCRGLVRDDDGEEDGA